jgi:Trk K+ transport system NAD-binding subunit
LHGLGLRIVEQLRQAGVRAVVVDDRPDARLVRMLRGWGVPHLAGDSRLVETLEQAGVVGADALICVEVDDLHILETALRARELRPDLRVVVQLVNPAVGRAIAEVLGPGSVLDVAALTAPSVVEACLGDPAHEVILGPERYLVAQVQAPRAGTLREVFGDLTPVGVIRPGDGRTGPVTGPAGPTGGGRRRGDRVLICPGRDARVATGDRVAVLGTPAELDAAGLAWAVHDRPDRGSRLRPGRAWPEGRRPDGAPADLLRYLVTSVAGAADHRLRTALGVLVGLVVASSAVLRAGYQDGAGRMSWVDGLYFTIETIGTVGYGDFSFREQPTWLRLFAIALMVFGAMLATVFFALLTNVLVGRQIEEEFGRRRVPGMSGHAVVVGIGSIGVRVVEGLLRRGREVVVVERDEANRYLTQVRALGVPVITGDATLGATLETANLAGAGAVAVLTSDDLTNLETGLAVQDRLAERWEQVPVVLRLFDRGLARTVERSFGFGHVRSTAALAAPWFVGAALGLDVLGTFYVGHTPVLAGRLTVADGGGLDGVTMLGLGATIRVVAIARRGCDQLEHLPRRATRLHGGDVAYLVGPDRELLDLLRRDGRSAGSGTISPSDSGGVGEPRPAKTLKSDDGLPDDT